MRRLKGFRTLAFNALAAIVPILQLSEVQAIIPPDWLPWYMLALVLGNMALRAITTTPVGRGETLRRQGVGTLESGPKPGRK